MLDSLTLTHTLSLFFGLYFLSAGLGMLLDREAIPEMFETIIKNPAIGFVTGLIAFVVGAAVISVHSATTGALATIISLFGWVALAEGILMLAFRKQFLGIFSFMARSQNTIFAFALLAMVMGAGFIWAGLQNL